jgi:hypothetical protein
LGHITSFSLPPSLRELSPHPSRTLLAVGASSSVSGAGIVIQGVELVEVFLIG